jgi:hypothetical protein
MYPHHDRNILLPHPLVIPYGRQAPKKLRHLNGFEVQKLL